MRIAFCTTSKGRLQHVERTIRRNIEDNSLYRDCVFVLVDYGSRDGLRGYIESELGEYLSSGRLVVYRYETDGPFRMAHAKNIAHRCGILEGGEVLVNMDADNFTGPGFAEWIDQAYSYEGDKVFLWARMIHRCSFPVRLSNRAGNNWCALPRDHEGPHSVFDHSEPETSPRVRGISGRIGVTAKAFLKLGGYDEEQFETWGHDDKDFSRRLERIGYRGVEIQAQHLGAIHHSHSLRFREYPHARPKEEGYDSGSLIPDPCKTVCNAGRIGLGTVFRNYRIPVELKPMPSRIFGVGMHKTGTTSLSSALKILGIDSAHWESGDWARKIWEEMKRDGCSRTVESHYALTDLPIAVLYRELDRSYPGSKFILTVRDEASWLRSVERHWSYSHNRYRWEWDVYPFANLIHRHIYGQTTFDAEVFVNRYRKHNDEVRDYFSGRTGDLLVMDMSRGSGWKELCGFLGMTAPAVDYPVEMVTRRR